MDNLNEAATAPMPDPAVDTNTGSDFEVADGSFELPNTGFQPAENTFEPDNSNTAEEPGIFELNYLENPAPDSYEEDFEQNYEQNQLEEVREELDQEMESDNNDNVEQAEDSLEEQIRALDEAIALLTFELEELKKMRGSALVGVLKNMLEYFIKDTFSDQAQNVQPDSQNEYVDSKISRLERDIDRLKSIRERLVSRSNN